MIFLYKKLIISRLINLSKFKNQILVLIFNVNKYNNFPHLMCVGFQIRTKNPSPLMAGQVRTDLLRDKLAG